MKTVLKWIVLVLFAGFVGIQFYRPARENPPIDPAQTLEATLQVPANVEETFKRSCNDCHTNNTDWRWYSNIAPISWQMVNHVTDGRKRLNFSTWKSLSASRQLTKLDDVCEQITSGEMPEWSYAMVHPEVKLSADEKKAVCDWTEAERTKLKQATTAGE